MGGSKGSIGPGGRRDRPKRESRPAPMVGGRAMQARRGVSNQRARMSGVRAGGAAANSNRSVSAAVRGMLRRATGTWASPNNAPF